MTKYYLVIDDGNYPDYVEPMISKTHAIGVAKKTAVSMPECNVFIKFERESDGQEGYLNSNGSYSLTGKSW